MGRWPPLRGGLRGSPTFPRAQTPPGGVATRAEARRRTAGTGPAQGIGGDGEVLSRGLSVKLGVTAITRGARKEDTTDCG